MAPKEPCRHARQLATAALTALPAFRAAARAAACRAAYDEPFVPPSPPWCSPYVYVDAHILATPAIADIDNDGVEELVVPVSYFYDLQYYDNEVGMPAERGM